MKILLTGATGFIGGHLLGNLLKEFGSDAVVVLSSRLISGVATVQYKDFRNFGVNADVFDNVTHVIHAGAFTPKDASSANNLELNFDNITYSLQLLSCDFKSLKKFINLSTLDVYANTGGVISEKSSVEPVSLYGSSKLYCEEMVKKFAAERAVDYLNLRIGHVYGPGEEKYKKVLPLAIENIIKNRPIELWGDGADLRSFIFIEDVVRAIMNSLEADVKNTDINIVSGNPISIKNLLLSLVQVGGGDINIEQRSSNHQKRDFVFNNSALRNTLLSHETDLLHGLKIEFDYMRKKIENNI